jgi:hypothetical protein
MKLVSRYQMVSHNFKHNHPFMLLISEENVWKLCESLKGRVDLNEFNVVFISNANKQVYVIDNFLSFEKVLGMAISVIQVLGVQQS